MEKIYTITVMTRFETDSLGWPEFGSIRTIGWIENKDDAYSAVRMNAGDMWEHCYEYAVVEEVPEGIYLAARNRQFFKFNEKTEQYEDIDEPEWMYNFVNVGIG